MTIVAVFLLTIFTVFIVTSYQSHIRGTDQFLTQALDKKRADMPNPPEGLPDAEPPHEGKPSDKLELPFAYALIVSVNQLGDIEVLENGANIEADELEKLVMEALNGQESGFTGSNMLMYKKRSSFDSTMLAFTSSEPIFNTLRSSILTSVVLFISGMLLMFFIAERLANYSIKPIEQAWKKQQLFVADASHDLKTPLTIILANNDILKSHTGSTISEEMKWIESTQIEAERMKELTEKLLDLAKSDSEEAPIELSSINISEVIGSLILQYEAVAFEKEITLLHNIEKEAFITTNKTCFVGILQVLLDNAIKYSPVKENISISLSTIGKRITFSINNKGLVIPEDMQQSIFERFVRGDKARSTKGYGLGLAIARSLSDKINGQLSVKTQLCLLSL